MYLTVYEEDCSTSAWGTNGHVQGIVPVDSLVIDVVAELGWQIEKWEDRGLHGFELVEVRPGSANSGDVFYLWIALEVER